MTGTTGMTDDDRVEIVLTYFRRVDHGGDVMALFHPDAEVYFPKYGVARGTAEIGQLFGNLAQIIRQIAHVPEHLRIFVDGETVCAEGITEGVSANGTPWRGGKTLAGLFCNIFEVRNNLIERCFIYLDPDYAGEDTQRYPWLREEARHDEGNDAAPEFLGTPRTTLS